MKILAFILALTCLAVPTLATEPENIVRAIKVEGAQRIESSTVLSYMPVRAGEPIDSQKAEAAVKALYATGFFADITLLQDGADLIVRVKENPIINRIGFEGNEEIKKEDLEREVQLQPRTVFTRAKAQADTDRILELYKRTGRYGASVVPKIVELEQNRVDLVFEIDEGKRTNIEKIQFVGNNNFSSRRLRDELATRETRWWRVFSTTDFYDEDRLNFDRELLRRFYLNQGYADFRVLSAVAELTPDKSDFFVTFTLEEGERYQFGTVELASEIKDLDVTSLQPELQTMSGEWYDASLVEKTINNLTTRAGDLQYAFVDIEPEVKRNKEARTIDITYRIKEGSRVFVDRINIKGNTRTLDRVIRRELLLAEGDPFNASKIKQSEQRVRDLGFFDTAKIDVKRNEDSDRADLDVNVVDKATGEVSVGAGFSTTDGLLGDFTVRERNFMGRGQNVRASATLSQRTQQYDLSFTEPYFLDRDLSAGVDLFRTDIDNQSSSSFDQQTNGFGLRLGYPLSEQLRQRLLYTLSDTKITNAGVDASRYVRDQQGERLSSSVSQELTWDERDSKLTPTDGWLLRLTNDFAGVGGDVQYFRTRLAGSYFYPIYDDVVFNLDGEVGHVVGWGGDEVRINDRFFIGADSLRGFSFAGIGPRDQTTGREDALGGKKFVRGSAEVGFPLGLPEELGIMGHSFVDAGTLWDSGVVALPGDVIKDDNSIRVGAGFGLSWGSPFGPIRFDIAQAIKKEDYDQTERFRFSFGTNF